MGMMRRKPTKNALFLIIMILDIVCTGRDAAAGQGAAAPPLRGGRGGQGLGGAGAGDRRDAVRACVRACVRGAGHERAVG